MNKSLLGNEFDPMFFEDPKKSNKIHVKHKSKTRKSPRKKQSENVNNESFSHQKNSLNLSQMFNYYTNHPLVDRQVKKPSKNLQHAYRSYTSSSVSKKKQQRSKSNHPSVLLAPDKAAYISNGQSGVTKKDKKFMKILDFPLGKYSKLFVTKGKSKSKSKGKGSSKGVKYFDITS